MATFTSSSILLLELSSYKSFPIQLDHFINILITALWGKKILIVYPSKYYPIALIHSYTEKLHLSCLLLILKPES